MHIPTAIALCLLLVCNLSAQGQKPEIFLNITEPSEYDTLAKEKYSEQYSITEIQFPANYKLPEKVSGEWPQWEKPATATAIFIVSQEGKIVEPHIVKKSQPEVENIILKALDTWVVTPPTLDGKEISIISAQEFTFGREEFVQLFMPSEEMQARVQDINQLAGFIDKIQAISQQYFAGQDSNASIVIALRPANKARYWIVTKPSSDHRELTNSLNKLKVPEVSDTVLFSVLSVATGSDFDPSRPILPDEWEEAAAQAGRPMPLDEVVDLVWQEENPIPQ
jgi:hypothetical protein